MFLGSLAKWLLLLWGVDAGNPDLVLLLVRVQYSYRVAVTDADDPTGQWRAVGC